MTWAVVKTGLMLLPFMLPGLAIGMSLSKVVAEKIMREKVVILLIIFGIALFLTNWL